MKKIEIEKDFMRKSNSFSYPNNLEDACCDFVATKSDNSKYLMEKETNQGENLNPNEIIEKLLKNICSLRLENQQLNIEKNAIIEQKEIEINELLSQIQNYQIILQANSISLPDKRIGSIEMLLQDVGEERNKLENRIEILKDELDYQIKNNEEYCNSLEKKFEKEKEEKLKNELNIIYHSHQKLSQKSIEFVEINEEKLNYYQNLAVNLKEELENIDVSHKKEISLVKELLGIQNMEKIEKLRKEYECKIKNLEMDKNASLNRHNDYVKDLEEVVNSLMFKISSLEAERNKLSQEIKTTNQEILKLYQQIQNYQNKIDELIPKYETDILKLHHKFSDEQNNLTFELKTLKKKMEISKSEDYVTKKAKQHKKNFSHDVKEISEWNKSNNLNLGYELSNFYGKSEEKKGSFYFKNSIVESVISNSQMSEKRNSDIKKSLMKLNENDFDKPSIEIESYTPSVKNLEKTKTSPKLNEYNEKNENMNQISLLKPSHFSSKENDKNINVTSFKLDENDEDFNQSFLKKQSAAQSRSFARDSKTKSYNVSNINFYNHINNTIILDSSNFMDTYFFNNENINVENFSQNFYIEENQRIIKKMGEESQIRAMSDNPNDNYQIFKKLIIFTKKLYAENLLIVKELLKKTLDKFDGYFELISIKIPGYEINSDGIIEYKIELFDKLLNKSWNFNSRYSKLRRLHLETKFSLALEGKNIKISDFPQRKFFGNKSKEFIEQRKWKLQTYFDNYLKNKNANSIMEKGILRYFFYREIWAEIEKSYLKRLKELDIIKNERNIGETPILIKINEIFEEIKKNLSLLDKNEAVIFIYYQNKFKSMDYKESLKIKN